MGRVATYNEKQPLTEAQKAYLLELGARAVQGFHGLDVDGMAGPATRQRLVPIPDGYDQIKAVYGNFSYEEGQKGRIHVEAGWKEANTKVVTLHTGKRVRLHKLVADEFRHLFERACRLSGYTPRSVQTYVPRHISWNADKPLSLHSWGIAVDFDPSDNPMGGVRKDGSPSLVRQHPEFLDVFRQAGWGIGADWGMKDDMHVQRAA